MADETPKSDPLKAYIERRRLLQQFRALKSSQINGTITILQDAGYEADLVIRKEKCGNGDPGTEKEHQYVQIKTVPVASSRVMPSRPEPARIQRPPGMHLAKCAGFLLTKEAYRRYVYPVIADMQQEYCDALAAGERYHARWIAIRGWLLVVPGWLVGVAARFIKKVFSA